MFLSRRSAVPFGCTLFLFHAGMAHADDDRVIVITPASIEQPRAQANTSLTVISRQTIEHSDATSVAELLRGQAGVQITDLFGDGTQASIDLRGFGPTASSNTLILVDGRRLNNSADNAAPDLSTIDLDDIERIEVLQGSAGVLYGNQAVGGVVNIIRKPIQQDETTLALSAGSYDATAFRGSIRRLIGQTQLAVSVSDRRSDNYREHNQTDRQDLQARLVRQHGGFTAFAELESSDEHYQTSGALLADEAEEDRRQSLPFYSDDYFDTRTDMVRVGIDGILDENRSYKLDLAQRVNDREFIQTFRPFPGSLTTQDRVTTNLGASYRLVPAAPQRYASIVFGLDLEQTDYELVSSLGPQAIEQDVADFYLSTQWLSGAHGRIDAGLRYSDKKAAISGDDFDDSVSVFSLGYSWSRKGLRLFVRADQNYRYPTVEENTNVPFADEPGLETQLGVSLEIGTEYAHEDYRYRATLYQIKLDDEIAFDSSGFANINVDETERLGLLFETSHQVSERTTVGLSLTLLDAEITDGPFAGNQLPLVAERSVRLDLAYQHNSQLSYAAELIAVGEQVLGGDFANDLDKLSSYQVLNLHASYRIKHWTLSARANNLLDEDYAEVGSQFTEFDPVTFAPTNFESFFPAPERNFRISAEYRFR